jgi:hypothetical protein
LLSAVLVFVLMITGAVFNAVGADMVKVWKWRDASGHVVYSTQPPPGDVKAEEKEINPNHNVIESGWPPPAPVAPASESAPLSERRSAGDFARSRRIAREGGGASTDEPPVPPAVTPAPAVPSAPALPSPPPPPAPAVPSPGPGGM